MDSALRDMLESLWIDVDDRRRFVGVDHLAENLPMKDALAHLTCAIENIKQSGESSGPCALPIESCKRLVEFRWAQKQCGEAFYRTHDREWQDLIRAEHAPEKTARSAVKLESSTPRRVAPTEQKGDHKKCENCDKPFEVAPGKNWKISVTIPMRGANFELHSYLCDPCMSEADFCSKCGSYGHPRIIDPTSGISTGGSTTDPCRWICHTCLSPETYTESQIHTDIKCSGCKANVDLSDSWTGRWFVSTGAPNVKYIKPGLWCKKCAGPLSSPGRCTALPSSICQRENETIIVNKSTMEERFSCGPCSASAKIQARGFVIKIGCDVKK